MTVFARIWKTVAGRAKFLKGPLLVHFGKIIFSLRRNSDFLRAKKKTPKRAKMGRKKKFLKVPVLVHFREKIFTLRRKPDFLMAENKSSKKGENGK